jgi:hypothetical protein
MFECRRLKVHSTVVLTSSEKYYVDVRVLKPAENGVLPNDPSDTEAVSQLQWAFAGTSTSTPAEIIADMIEKPAHTVWSHWIDSDTLEEVRDEGDMYPQPDGTVLETGVMPNPETGLEMDYEELWEDLDTKSVGEEKQYVCYVLRMDEPSASARGMVIRIGEWIQGIVRVGEHITVTRLHYDVQEVGLFESKIRA